MNDTAPKLVLSALPQDDRLWEVVGHGKIRAPTEVDEATVEVFLAEAGWDKVSWTPPALVETRAAWLGLGQLPLIPNGSTWRQGVCFASSKRQRKRVTVTGASRLWPDAELGRTIAYQASPRAPWTPAYPIGQGDDTPLFRVTTDDGGALWVSPLEVARATFGVTSQWLRLMVEGRMHFWPDEKGKVIDPARSGRMRDARSLKVWAHRNLDELDVLAAARVCADKGLRVSFDEVNAGLVRNGFGRGPAHVRMPFPFRRPSTWTIEECWIGTEGLRGHVTKRRLITRILDVDYDLGVDHIRVFYPGRVELEDEDLADKAGSGRSRLCAKAGIADELRLISGQASWSALGVLKKPSAHSRTSAAWKVEHIAIATDEPQSSAIKTISVDEEIKIATTAGHGANSERGGRVAIRINIKDKVQEKMDAARPPLTRVASTILALQTLAADVGRQLEIVRPGDQPGSDLVDRLWRYPTDGGAIRWATTKEGRQRRALVARLQRDRGWVYFFDTEHLEVEQSEDAFDADREARSQDGYSSLCLLFPPGQDLLSGEMIGDILRTNAIARGVWRRSLKIPMTTVRRNSAWLHDHGAYARAILRAILRLETGPDELSN